MCLINSDNFQEKVIKSKKPVLIVYIKQFFDYKNQTDVIFQISNFYEDVLKVCVADEEDPFIFDTLGIIGSPSYFIFFQGNEVQMAFGVQDRASLFSFVSTALQGLGFINCFDEAKIANTGRS
jgi:hypothetical protein